MARHSPPVPIANALPLADRVRDVARELGCTILWTRANMGSVLLGLGGSEAFARVISLGGNAFGLAFRAGGEAATAEGGRSTDWEPMLLVDDLANVVEHALVAESALPLQASGM